MEITSKLRENYSPVRKPDWFPGDAILCEAGVDGEQVFIVVRKDTKEAQPLEEGNVRNQFREDLGERYRLRKKSDTCILCKGRKSIRTDCPDCRGFGCHLCDDGTIDRDCFCSIELAI